MRILLLNPPFGGLYHRLNFILPPLGLAYLASCLREKGHAVFLWDLNVQPPTLDLSSYDLVGITADTPRYPQALLWARRAREAGARVVLGGPHVTFEDEEILRSGTAEVVVRGEAEETFPRLVEALQAGKDLASLAGLSYLEEGKIKRTPDSPPPLDLDRLPFPARDLLPMSSYRRLRLGGRPITSLLTSRGCPFLCTFCASSRFSGTRWRTRSLASIVEEIERIIADYGFRALAFLDDNFTLDPGRVVAICEEIISRGWDLKWWCFSRPDTVLRHPEMVEAMAAAGARYVFMGLESAHQRVLDSYGKKARAEEAREAVRLLQRFGIDATASYVLGGMEETEEMIRSTVHQALQLRAGSAQFSLLTPYPGTRLYELVKERIFEEDWSKFDCLHPTFYLDHISPRRLSQLLHWAYRCYYLRPSRLWSGLLSSIRGRGITAANIVRMMAALRDL